MEGASSAWSSTLFPILSFETHRGGEHAVNEHHPATQGRRAISSSGLSARADLNGHSQPSYPFCTWRRFSQHLSGRVVEGAQSSCRASRVHVDVGPRIISCFAEEAIITLQREVLPVSGGKALFSLVLRFQKLCIMFPG